MRRWKTTAMMMMSALMLVWWKSLILRTPPSNSPTLSLNILELISTGAATSWDCLWGWICLIINGEYSLRACVAPNQIDAKGCAAALLPVFTQEKTVPCRLPSTYSLRAVKNAHTHSYTLTLLSLFACLLGWFRILISCWSRQKSCCYVRERLFPPFPALNHIQKQRVSFPLWSHTFFSLLRSLSVAGRWVRVIFFLFYTRQTLPHYFTTSQAQFSRLFSLLCFLLLFFLLHLFTPCSTTSYSWRPHPAHKQHKRALARADRQSAPNTRVHNPTPDGSFFGTIQRSSASSPALHPLGASISRNFRIGGE